VGFEPTISAGERPQTYTLDKAASGNGKSTFALIVFEALKMDDRCFKRRKPRKKYVDSVHL
jgi:hypothetical protein